jgi:hypothetical protein
MAGSLLMCDTVSNSHTDTVTRFIGFPTSTGSRTPNPKPNPPPVPEPEPEGPTEEPEPMPDPAINPSGEKCSRSLVFDAACSIRGDLFFFKSGYIRHYRLFDFLELCIHL